MPEMAPLETREARNPWEVGQRPVPNVRSVASAEPHPSGVVVALCRSPRRVTTHHNLNLVTRVVSKRRTVPVSTHRFTVPSGYASERKLHEWTILTTFMSTPAVTSAPRGIVPVVVVAGHRLVSFSLGSCRWWAWAQLQAFMLHCHLPCVMLSAILRCLRNCFLDSCPAARRHPASLCRHAYACSPKTNEWDY